MNYIVLVRLMQKSGFKTSNVKFWNRVGHGGPRTTKPRERPKIQVCHPHERGSIDFRVEDLLMIYLFRKNCIPGIFAQTPPRSAPGMFGNLLKKQQIQDFNRFSIFNPQ